jgi:phage gp36-like protein
MMTVFGRDNLLVWADINNNGRDMEIGNRIEYFLVQATALIDGRLMNRQYDLPFNPVPFVIKHCCVLLAGVALFEARNINTTNEKQTLNVATYREQAESILTDVVSGAIKLNNYMYGMEVVEDIRKNVDDKTRPFPYPQATADCTLSESTGVNADNIWEHIHRQQIESCRKLPD